MSKGESSTAQLTQHLLNSRVQQSQALGNSVQPQNSMDEMILNQDNLKLNIPITIPLRNEIINGDMRNNAIPLAEMETIFTQSQLQFQHQRQLPVVAGNSDWAREFDNTQRPMPFPMRSNFNQFNSSMFQRTIPARMEDSDASHISNLAWKKEFEKHSTDSIDQPLESTAKGDETKSERDWTQEFQDIWNNLKLSRGETQDYFPEFNHEQTLDETFDLLNTPSQYEFEPNNPYMKESNPYLLGLELVKSNGSLSLAALAFEAECQLNEANSDAWYLLGKVQAENEKEIPAIIALEKSLNLNPLNSSALLSLAVSYVNEGNTTKAHSSLHSWLQQTFPELNIPTFTRNAHDDLVEAFLKAVQKDSNSHINADLQMALGLVFYNVADYSKTIDCFTCALSTKTSDYLLWNRLGATLSNSGKSIFSLI